MPGAYSSKRHFLFDLDGTLVDSTPVHARAFADALSPRHPALGRSFEYSHFAGCPTREVFIALGLREEPELTELTEGKQRLYRAAIERGEIKVFPGVKLLLERLREKGCSLFLVTGASRVSTERVLAVTKLAHFFAGVTTADDAHPGKPSPEPYLHTLRRYGLKAGECLAIEDGQSGIAAARSAGLDAVLIHTGLELADVTNVLDCETFSALLFS
jgi:HAD superfamily hydrolase (TIGR01509 family)